MSLWLELRRRNVFKVGMAYAIVAWLLVQVVVSISGPLNFPDWFDAATIVLLAIGFPIAILLAWAYEVTPEGIKPTDQVARAESITGKTGQRLNVIVIGLLAAAVMFFAVNSYFSDNAGEVLPHSIAVLPLENLSPDPEHDFFAPGIHDTILSELAKIGGLNVIARTSVLRYADGATPIPEIARELKVQTIMEGSVQFAEGHVLVTAQLIDPDTEAHLWTGNYNMEFKDIFEIQADIAKKIAEALKVELLPDEVARIGAPLTDSPEAYEWYLRERTLPFWEEYPDTIPTHVGYLDEAIALDPDFAAAYAWRSMAQQRLLTGRAAARADAEKAVELDPSLGVAHMALAFSEYAARDIEAARRAYENAYESSPKDTRILSEYGRFLAGLGDEARGQRLAKAAVELAPNGYPEHIILGQVLAWSSDREGSLAALRRAADIEPAFPGSFVFIAMVQNGLGNEAAALEAMERAETLWNAPPAWALGQLAWLYGHLGDPTKAERYARELDSVAALGEQPVSLVDLLNAALGVGNLDRVRGLLVEIAETCPEACNEQPVDLRQLKSNIGDDPVLAQPEFADLRNRIRAY